ncbi:MAG: arylesterase [Acidobacteriota bacterium]
MRLLQTWRLVAVALLVAGGFACGRPADVSQAQPAAQAPLPEPGQLPESQRVVITILGDSLTAGLGLTVAEAYPARIQEMFATEGYRDVEISNAGVSGDTTAGGLRRIESLLGPNVRIVVVALGGNDALRGLGVAQTRENVSAIVSGLLERGIRVMVAGMESPTNLGDDYQRGFHEAFAQVNATYRGRITFVPFLLEGVAGNPALNQPDGIHPNAQGARIVAEHLYPLLRGMVDQLPVGPSS